MMKVFYVTWNAIRRADAEFNLCDNLLLRQKFISEGAMITRCYYNRIRHKLLRYHLKMCNSKVEERNIATYKSTTGGLEKVSRVSDVDPSIHQNY